MTFSFNPYSYCLFSYIEEQEEGYYFLPHSKLLKLLIRVLPRIFKRGRRPYLLSIVFQSLNQILFERGLYVPEAGFILKFDPEFQEVFGFEYLNCDQLELEVLDNHLEECSKENVSPNTNHLVRNLTWVSLEALWATESCPYVLAFQRGSNLSERKLYQAPASLERILSSPPPLLPGVKYTASELFFLLIHSIELADLSLGRGLLRFQEPDLKELFGFEVVRETDLFPLFCAQLSQTPLSL